MFPSRHCPAHKPLSSSSPLGAELQLVAPANERAKARRGAKATSISISSYRTQSGPKISIWPSRSRTVFERVARRLIRVELGFELSSVQVQRSRRIIWADLLEDVRGITRPGRFYRPLVAYGSQHALGPTVSSSGLFAWATVPMRSLVLFRSAPNWPLRFHCQLLHRATIKSSKWNWLLQLVIVCATGDEIGHF